MAGVGHHPVVPTRGAGPRPSLVRAAVALPVLVWIVVAGVWIVGVSAGSDFIFPVPDRVTLSEAAALGDLLEIGRQIDAGVDLNVPRTVREGVIDDRPHTLSPVEAARAAGRQDVAALLIELGAGPPVRDE